MDVESLVSNLKKLVWILIKTVIITFVLYTTTDRTLGVPLSLLPVSVELLPLLSCS